ncbi:TIM barrel protein [Leptolyngbya sp. AN03gr2]|uniref:TIM barrel protein n=1 Tax=unclassified Leptolyngbya TaxID=2650499 RepID=UPI003D31AAA0
MKEIWVSLSTYGGVPTRTVLETFWTAGVRHVELAIGVKPSADTVEVLQEYGQCEMQYRAHHAIVWQEHRAATQIPQGSFNLAQQFDRSYFERLTDWMAGMNIIAYSVHPGSVSVHRSDSFDQWLDHLEQLAQLCCDRRIRFGVETMYPSVFDHTRRDLMRSLMEIEQFLTVLPQIEIVVDMAHLNLWHDCSIEEKLRLFQLAQNRILEIHISDNDGLRDTHTAINERTWWVPHIASFPSDVPIVLESRMNHQSSEQVRQQIQYVQALFD